MPINISDFKQEKDCVYKDEHYSVRDNGSVLKYPKDNNRPRPTDNRWTFGNPNEKTGYMEIATVRIHRIVAFAFLGESPIPQHIVDHIDTNRQNNRPENLQWVTKLENALNNPITRKRIILSCGSIEAFLADPSKLRESAVDTDFKWMRTVSTEDAQVSKERLLLWAESDKPSSGGKLDEWIFKREIVPNEQKIEEIFKQIEKKTGISRQSLCFNKTKKNEYYEARKYAAKLLRSELNLSDYEIGKLIGISATTVNLYLEVCADWYSGDFVEVKEYTILSEQSMIIPKNVIQKNWGTQSEFPCCPQKVHNNPIAEYAAQLEENSILFQNTYYFTTVVKSAIIDKVQSLLVLYEIVRKEIEIICIKITMKTHSGIGINKRKAQYLQSSKHFTGTARPKVTCSGCVFAFIYF